MGETTASAPASDDESYSVYELCAVYARDYGSHRTIEQLIECTAPSDASKEQLKRIVADTTGRQHHSIQHLEIVHSAEREQVEETMPLRTGEVELGEIRV